MIWLLAAWCIGAALVGIGLGRCMRTPQEDCLEGEGDGDARPPTTAVLEDRPEADSPESDEDLGQVGRMLTQLQRHQARLAQTVVLCWIGGLSTREAAATLGVSPLLVEHDLALVHELLQRQLGPLAPD